MLEEIFEGAIFRSDNEGVDVGAWSVDPEAVAPVREKATYRILDELGNVAFLLLSDAPDEFVAN